MYPGYILIDFYVEKARSSANFLKLRISLKQVDRIVNY